MKAMWSAFAVMVLITIAAPFALKQVGFSAADKGTGTAVRLSNE